MTLFFTTIAVAFHSNPIARSKISKACSINKYSLTTSKLYASNNDDKPKKRKIIKYDNVGDPIYEDEYNSQQGGMNILGISTNLDPLALTALGFGAIAFNFFVLANL